MILIILSTKYANGLLEDKVHQRWPEIAHCAPSIVIFIILKGYQNSSTELFAYGVQSSLTTSVPHAHILEWLL